MKVISIKQPYAWAIVAGIKDVENRSWMVNHRGSVLIHASQRVDRGAVLWMKERGIDVPDVFETGGIVGQVDIVDIVKDHGSEWALPGEYHWVLTNPKPRRFQPLRGRLGLFDV